MNSLEIRLKDGGFLCLEVDPTTTLKEVKEMIREKKGIPIEKQRLIFVGKELEDQHNLADYNVLQKEQSVFLVLRD